MKFTETSLVGAFVAFTDMKFDNRGSFERFFCKNEMSAIGFTKEIVQINHSINSLKGTVRGLHFQKEPFAETKIIKCIKGGIFDVIVDLRENSSTFLNWYGVELTDKNSKMLIIPEGFAHGFQTLEDNSELIYFHTNYYNKNSECALNILDPFLEIKLPIEISEISDKDKNHKFIENIKIDIPDFKI
jgi:dTDP-4-dehydrorhamnose 3,5-epimerase